MLKGLALVEGAVKWVIEDVGWVMETAGDAVAAVLVLELDGACGVVGIAGFTADVGDEDGDAAAI